MEDELELRGQATNVLHLATVPAAAGGAQLVSAGDEGAIQIWDPRSGESVAGPVKVDAMVWDVRVVGLGADRPALATCGSEAVALWDLSTFGAENSPHVRYDVDYATGMAVVPATHTSPDLLVTAEKDLVRVIDPRDGVTVSAIRWPATPAGKIGNRVYHPTGVRFGDGTAGFAFDYAGELEVWRLSGRELTGRTFGLSQPFRGVMTYLPGEHGQAWLAVAAGRGIEVWDLDRGNRLARGELDIPFDALAPVRLADRTLVAAAFGKHRESGVLLWDPATRRPATGLFNRHGPDFGDPNLGGVAIHAVIAVPDPSGTTRIASAGNDGAVRVSAPVDVLLERGATTASEPTARSARRGGGNFAFVRDGSGNVIGFWFASMEHARDEILIETALYREDLTHLMGRPRRIVPNTVDGKGGAFVLFDGG